MVTINSYFCDTVYLAERQPEKVRQEAEREKGERSFRKQIDNVLRLKPVSPRSRPVFSTLLSS